MSIFCDAFCHVHLVCFLFVCMFVCLCSFLILYRCLFNYLCVEAGKERKEEISSCLLIKDYWFVSFEVVNLTYVYMDFQEMDWDM